MKQTKSGGVKVCGTAGQSCLAGGMRYFFCNHLPHSAGRVSERTLRTVQRTGSGGGVIRIG